MNMEYLSIYLVLFKFFSLEIFGFGHINFCVYFVKLVPKYLYFEGANVNGGRRQWHLTPVLLPGESHGRRSLVRCSPWGR